MEPINDQKHKHHDEYTHCEYSEESEHSEYSAYSEYHGIPSMMKIMPKNAKKFLDKAKSCKIMQNTLVNRMLNDAKYAEKMQHDATERQMMP